jgi:hypothetical protein
MNKLTLSREHFQFVVETILNAALDRIEAGLPDSIDWDTRESLMNGKTVDLIGYEHGAIETAGMVLACLQVPITDEGLSIYDALKLANNFHKACEKFVANAWKNKGKNLMAAQAKLTPPYQIKKLYGQFHYPDVAKHAKAFTKATFA